MNCAFIAGYIDNPYECDVKAIEPSVLTMVEADSYWCLAKLLDGIQVGNNLKI